MPALRWQQYKLSHGGDAVSRRMAEQLAPISALASARRSAGEPAEQTLHLPDLPPAPVAKATALLHAAAQVEHALMVQYLYAGYSFAPTQREIVNVAVEEMSHLLTVQNLLRAIGQHPHLHRQVDGPATSDDERLFPFDFRLEPVSHLSLAKYVVAESPASAPDGVDPDLLARIVDLATGAASEPVNRVGTLYALLGVVFGTPQLLLELAATGDPWYVVVNRLATEAAAVYGGPQALHLPDDAFDPASAPQQASDQDWDRSREGAVDEFRVHVIASRRDALEALRDIGLQGEGPSPVVGETSHFRRFHDMFVRYFGADGAGTDRPPQVLDVPAGAAIVLDPDGSGDDVISDPTTIRWARLADLRYAVLLGSLERYLRAVDEERASLRGWCFAEMFALSELAGLLRRMPRDTSGAPRTAALPFTLPPWLAGGAEWSDLVAAFDECLTIAAGLRAEVVAGSAEHRLLVHLLASDERKHGEATARAAGESTRTRTDAVRDALDWAAGAGDPNHGGPQGSNGRFWNLQNAEFTRVVVFGSEVTTPPEPGVDAPLVDMLRNQAMPQGRPKLAEDGAEFVLVERWVAEGCPE